MSANELYRAVLLEPNTNIDERSEKKKKDINSFTISNNIKKKLITYNCGES